MFDSAELAGALDTAEHRARFVETVREVVRQRVGAASVKQCLTFHLLSDATVVSVREPAASREYISVLADFIRQRSHGGYVVDSAITPVALQGVSGAVEQFFTSDDTRAVVAATLERQLRKAVDVAEALEAELRDEQAYLSREIAGGGTSERLAGAAIDASSAAVVSFIHSAAGHTLLLALAKVMGTAAGKVMMARLITAIVTKALSAAAFKAALLTAIRKVGVTVLIKTVVGKALLAMLAAIGIVHIPIFWVVAPIILAVIAKDVSTLPSKLAEKVSDGVASDLAERFDLINAEIARAFASEATAALNDEIGGGPDPLPAA